MQSEWFCCENILLTDTHPITQVQQMLQANLLARKQRVETFLQRLRCERMLFFERLAPTVQ